MSMSIALAGFALVIYSHSLWAATPQESSAVHFLARSTAAAAAGDTSTAIAILESGISDMPNEPRLLAEAAWLYALRASDLTTVFVDRKKAEDYALRAWRLDPRDPTPWGALAWVRFKQHLTDQAWKFIGRARESPGFEEASTEFRAELHYLGARIWKRHVDDYEHLVRAPSDLPVSSPECIGLGYGLAVRDGLARYRVTLELEGVEERSLPLRVLRGIARAVGSGDEQERPWVEWEREVVLEGRDRSVDWLVLQRVPAGAHRIILTVRDEMSGAAATADRRIEALDDEGGSREEAGR